MYKHIVIPVEIATAQSYEDAAAAASALLTAGGKVTLLHAIEPIPTYVSTYVPPELSMRSRDEAKAQLQEMAHELGTENTALVFGSAGRSIVDWAK